MTRNFSQINCLKKGIIFLFLLGAFSCSGQSTDSSNPPDAPMSEADLLDGNGQATEVSDSSIFSDLNPSSETSSGLIDKGSSNAGSIDSDSPFYSPIGGENLGKVAYTLYGSRNKASLLEEKNPGLSRNQALSAGDKVYFEFAGLNPQVRFLTKDLIDRYPVQLAESIQSSNLLNQTTTVVASGETLQMISQRLYGTTRYWTEIYLLNHKELKSYDSVRSGISLVVYQRDMQLANSEVTGTTSESNGGGYSPSMRAEDSAMNSQPTPTVSEVGNNQTRSSVVEQPSQESVKNNEAENMHSQPPSDPIPDMESTQSESSSREQAPSPSAPPPPAYVPHELATPTSNDSGVSGLLGSTTNLRRVVFVALVVIIGLVAFFMTGSKRKKKFDMLDVTSTDTATRPKLQKNANSQDVG